MTEIIDSIDIKIEPTEYIEVSEPTYEENKDNNPYDCYISVDKVETDELGRNSTINDKNCVEGECQKKQVNVGKRHTENPYGLSSLFPISNNIEPKRLHKRKSVPRKVVQSKEYEISENHANTTNKHECRTCGKSFKCKPKLTVHLRIHTGERPFVCSVCNKGFRMKWTMQVHETSHQGLKPYSCEQCDKKYTSAHQLKIHFRTHTGERPYCCKICQKDFKDRWKLTMHEKTHLGLKPFECDECDKKYTTKYQLTTHKRLHTKDKLFCCKVCTRQFTEKCKLALHEQTHLGLKPYCCDICDKRYKMKSHLKFHIESAHLQGKSK